MFHSFWYSESSYSKTTNDLVTSVRELLYEKTDDRVLIQLFEQICILHGYVASSIRSNNSVDENTRKEIGSFCKSVQDLIKSHRQTLDQIQGFPTINDSFNTFHQQFQVIIYFELKTKFSFDRFSYCLGFLTSSD